MYQLKSLSSGFVSMILTVLKDYLDYMCRQVLKIYAKRQNICICDVCTARADDDIHQPFFVFLKIKALEIYAPNSDKPSVLAYKILVKLLKIL